MSALLNCTVISVQNTHFTYESCAVCTTKVTLHQNRCRCPKCGFTCEVQNVDYRYRLSLKVSRDKNIFGVTIFGGCLNPFFGITANNLQRFLNSSRKDGQQNVPTIHDLLFKAVEDCFIGKSFILGFKNTALNSESGLLSLRSSLGHSAESAQFVACQIIPPNGASLGISVFSYLQSLLRTNSHLGHFASSKPLCPSQDKDSLVSSFENTLPLCVRSYSENSAVGLPHTCPWYPTSNISLCFSPEERSGRSLQILTVDDGKSSPAQSVHSTGSKHDPEWTTMELSMLSQSLEGQVNSTDALQHVEHYGTHNGKRVSSVSSSTLCKFHQSAAETSSLACAELNPNTSCSHESKTPGCNFWPSPLGLPCTESSPSHFEKSHFNPSCENISFALEEAPLSETLRAFINTQPQISEAVNRSLFSPTSMCSMHKKDGNTPQKSRKKHYVLFKSDVSSKSNAVADVGSSDSYQPGLSPLHNITNVIQEKNSEMSLKRKQKRRKILFASKASLSGSLKVSQVCRDSSLNSSCIKDRVSKRASFTKNLVNTTRLVHNTQKSDCFKNISPGQRTEEKESRYVGQEDEYNCSADLFFQNSMDINAEKSVSDPHEMRKGYHLDANISEHEVVNAFHFAPSLQSTPKNLSHPHHHQRRVSKQHRDPQQSNKLLTLTPSMRILRHHNENRQRCNAGRAEPSSTQSSEPKQHHNGEHEAENSVSPTSINEWSRDLFANSFGEY